MSDWPERWRRRLGALAVLAVGLLACLPATAQTAPAARAATSADALSGVLERIHRRGAVRIGYREHALPFSFGRPGAVPHGYSIDLCLAIVEEIAEAIGGHPLRIEYRVVTPADRIDRVVAGEIDLECGATTATAERRAKVAFSPMTFVTGTRLAVPSGSGIRTRGDLVGRQVVVAAGTTNEQVIRGVVARTGLRTTIVTAPDLAQAFARVESGQAHAVASDDVLLLGYLAETGQRARWNVVGELLSHEPYGIVYARDDAPLAEVVNAAFARLAHTRELRWIYARWFERQLPSGIRLGLPMGPELQRSFEMLGLPTE